MAKKNKVATATATPVEDISPVDTSSPAGGDEVTSPNTHVEYGEPGMIDLSTVPALELDPPSQQSTPTKSEVTDDEVSSMISTYVELIRNLENQLGVAVNENRNLRMMLQACLPALTYHSKTVDRSMVPIINQINQLGQ
jgi:hypothetical protein